MNCSKVHSSQNMLSPKNKVFFHIAEQTCTLEKTRRLYKKIHRGLLQWSLPTPRTEMAWSGHRRIDRSSKPWMHPVVLRIGGWGSWRLIDITLSTVMGARKTSLWKKRNTLTSKRNSDFCEGASAKFWLDFWECCSFFDGTGGSFWNPSPNGWRVYHFLNICYWEKRTWSRIFIGAYFYSPPKCQPTKYDSVRRSFNKKNNSMIEN